jgi:FlaA1/EpsC-like NDP-sugar epimerase
MRHIIRNKIYFMLMVDAVLVVACFFLAYLFRFEFAIPDKELATISATWPFVLLIKLCTFFFFRLYKGMYRYTSLEDLTNVLKAVFTSSLLIILTVLMIHCFVGYPRSIFIIDGFLTFLAIGGIRMAIRIYFAGREGRAILPALSKKGCEKTRLLIIGAGDAGEKIIREIRDNPGLRFTPVGLLDDDTGKQGKTIHCIPILGTLKDITRFTDAFDEILIAIPSGKGHEMRQIVEQCKSIGKPYKTIPSIGELINGHVSIKAVRDVNLADLLGREEVHLDHKRIKNFLHQKRILVTGAGGTIGRELVRQISQFKPIALGLLDISELNLFQVEMECHQRFSHLSTPSFLVDIRDRRHIERVFKEFRPQVIFHAAAYKHVPLQELNPWEAVYNNVLGSRNLLEGALENGVDRFVFVSTDKAVRPTNVMGATKRVAEMLISCLNHTSDSCFMAVRFGNVVGSSGSAIPVFQEQIARGGPVTVTHTEMTRYFMSVSEAAQLILQAGAMGNGDEIFILEMGEPHRILDIAHDLIRLHGFEPDQDIPIQFTGLRPGEKLYEELISEGEGIVKTQHEKILVLHANRNNCQMLNTQIDELLSIARTYDAHAIKRKLKEIVPEYTPQF